MRERLGGRSESEAGRGEVVRFELAPGMPLVGVVLFVEADNAHVLLDGGTVRRVDRNLLSPAMDGIHEELAALASDVRAFGELNEGDPVRYTDSRGITAEGVLIEKCRYGALVARPDRAVMGIGFRKLWPLVEGSVEGTNESEASQ